MRYEIDHLSFLDRVEKHGGVGTLTLLLEYEESYCFPANRDQWTPEHRTRYRNLVSALTQARARAMEVA